MDVTGELRAYWDEDAATYDRAPSHGTSTPTERAAWNAALSNGLPPPPARILDVGAGTGFLTLAVAALGHRVTALDLSPGMLAKLERKVADAGLEVEVVTAPADRPPAGPFDAVIERHLLWTLPSPADALAAWRAVAPEGTSPALRGAVGRGGPDRATPPTAA